ncbi:restriction endonuclease [Marinimicrobium sp. ABcell2]|uniref:restriction endonuclease n=1 Tax=Marinimicrobium sp. ABcell2 TaxID=3069751 RepID=UPI0027AF43F1|nr:restriction endonuclease [Marinimicrobium sp. ABcell2]MDQ2077757.1 restriction endonuclease [Marinimicrobium sp. ABcell2]
MKKKFIEGEDAVSGLREINSQFETIAHELESQYSLSRAKYALDCLTASTPVTYGAPLDSFKTTIERHTGGKISVEESGEILNYLEKLHRPHNKFQFTELCNHLSNFEGKVEIIEEGYTLLDLFKNSVWVPFFADNEKIVAGLACAIRRSLDRILDTHQKLFLSNYSGIDCPYVFEEFVADIFEGLGYEVNRTPRSGDYGIDIIARSDSDCIAIQVKRYSIGNNIGAKEVQTTLGGMQYADYRANKSIIITTSDFTVRALQQAKGCPIELWTSEDLYSVVREHIEKTIKNLDTLGFK